MRSEQDTRRTLAARLACRLMAQEDPLAVRRILESEGFMVPSQMAADDDTETEHEGPRRVGIWEAREENGDLWFMRRNELDAFGFWARCERIPSKSSRTRIVLLGESVARGFLYDPHYNPATALQQVLGKSFGNNVEVIDLARTGASYLDVMETAESAVALHPDAYVVFAGNNWMVPGGVSLAELADALKSGEGWRRVQDLIRRQLHDGVARFAGFLGKIATEQMVPIIFVIPEFSIEWRSDFRWEPPILSYEERHRWRKLLAETQNALDQFQFERAAAKAKEMVEIDDGTSPVALELQAQAERALGRAQSARLLMDLACNSGLYLPIPKKDRCSPVLQDALRQELPKHGVAVADFPGVCREYLGDSLPDSRIFLDYCHLTAGGIGLAMACAAEALLPQMGKPFQSWRQLIDIPIAMDDKVEAQARFSAAVLASICGQDEGTICRYLDEAVRLAPELLDLALLIAEACICRIPLLLCDAFDKLLAAASTFPAIARLAYDSPQKEKELNLLLVGAIRKVAAAKRPEALDFIDELLLREHSVENVTLDLLHPAYCDIGTYQMDYGWRKSSAYLISHEYESRFRLFWTGSKPLVLTLIYRTPRGLEAHEEPAIWLNGREVKSFPAAPAWKTLQLNLPFELLRRGLNILSVRWPEPKRSREQLAAFIASTMMTEGRSRHSWDCLPAIYGVYGEVFSCSISAADTTSGYPTGLSESTCAPALASGIPATNA